MTTCIQLSELLEAVEQLQNYFISYTEVLYVQLYAAHVFLNELIANSHIFQ